MKRHVPLILAAALLSNASCHHFWSKKPSTPKESSKVASEVEKDFMRRWIDKRTSDLVAAGTPAATAHDQATAEFKDKFGYTDAARGTK